MTIDNLGATADQPAASVQQEVLDIPAGEQTGSMDDTIRQAYRASQAATHEAPAEPEVDEPVGRQRGANGKFLKKDGEAAPEVSGEPEATDEPAQPKPHDAAPNTWKKDAAAEFAKLPEAARLEIHRREQDFHKGIAQYKDAAGFAQSVVKELTPYQQTMQQHNVPPVEVIRRATQAWNALVTGTPEQKSATLLQIARDYGIDLSSLGSAPPQTAAERTQEDPTVSALKRELGEIKSHLTSQERQRAQAEFQTHLDQVSVFAAKPEHEHFESVREDMAALIDSGRAKDLQDAYDKAIWANPDVRAQLLAKQDQERTRRQADEAAAARKAAGANVQRRGTPPVPNKPGTMEDTIRQLYRKNTGGG